MRRRRVLALVGSVGASTIAGCSGGGNNGDGGPSGEGCVPETDDLSSLFPDDAEGFELRNAAQSGLDIGTDTYVVARYNSPDDNPVGVIAARYESSSAAQQGVESIRSEGTQEVVGTLVDGSIAIGVDAQSESTARALIRASEISDDCASQLSFSSGDGEETSTTTEPSFQVGDPIWGQRGGGSSGTYAVDATGVTADEPSSYTTSITYPPVFTENAAIYGNAIREKSTGEAVRQLPAEATNTPAVVGEKVFYEAEAEVVAADITTGEELWRYTPTTYPAQVIATDEVVVAGLQQSTVALSPSDGSRMWSIDAVGTESRAYSSAFEIAGGRLYVWDNAQIYNISDGSEAGFDANRGGPYQIDNDGNVYHNTEDRARGDLTKYSSDGSQMWQITHQGVPLAVDSNHLYTVFDDTVKALSKSDGGQQWSFESPNGLASQQPVAVGAENVYIAGSVRLFVVDKSSGERTTIYPYDNYLNNWDDFEVSVGGGVVALTPAGSPFDPTALVLTEQ